MTQPGRNDPCPCGSGNKYKRCCLEKDEAARSAELVRRAEAAAATAAASDAPDSARGPTGQRPAIAAAPKVKERPPGGGPPGARRRAV